MSKPRLLDIFCKAGGAAAGYARAGFDVTGVDLEPQPRFPYAFIQADAFRLDLAFLRSFDAIHASPPCQGYTSLRHAPGALGAPRLIGEIRKRLDQTGKPYIIENVEQAGFDMRDPVRLCGSMFNLAAQGCQLQRHRLFESNIPIAAPCDCQHHAGPTIGVYGGHARNRAAKRGGRTTRDVWDGGHKAAASEAMGIDWMTLSELSEAIPPAFTTHLGLQLMAHLQASGRNAA